MSLDQLLKSLGFSLYPLSYFLYSPFKSKNILDNKQTDKQTMMSNINIILLPWWGFKRYRCESCLFSTLKYAFKTLCKVENPSIMENVGENADPWKIKWIINYYSRSRVKFKISYVYKDIFNERTHTTLFLAPILRF